MAKVRSMGCAFCMLHILYVASFVSCIFCIFFVFACFFVASFLCLHHSMFLSFEAYQSILFAKSVVPGILTFIVCLFYCWIFCLLHELRTLIDTIVYYTLDLY